MTIWEDLWVRGTALLASGFLMAVVPIAKATNIDFNDVLLTKNDLNTTLKKHDLKEKFVSGGVSCACCKQPLTYSNLGGINDAPSSIDMTCLNPGCSIKL